MTTRPSETTVKRLFAVSGNGRGLYSEWRKQRMGRVVDSFFSEFVVVCGVGRAHYSEWRKQRMEKTANGESNEWGVWLIRSFPNSL
jgi:hypothetical protein